MSVDVSGATRAEQIAARKAYLKLRKEFLDTAVPTKREDLMPYEATLVKLLMSTKGFRMTIDVDPPSYDSDIGSFKVNILHPQGTFTGSGVHLYDAAYMAQARLHDHINPPPVINIPETVEVPNFNFKPAAKIDFDF